jgi:hypothetical protein
MSISMYVFLSVALGQVPSGQILPPPTKTPPAPTKVVPVPVPPSKGVLIPPSPGGEGGGEGGEGVEVPRDVPATEVAKVLGEIATIVVKEDGGSIDKFTLVNEGNGVFALTFPGAMPLLTSVNGKPLVATKPITIPSLIVLQSDERADPTLSTWTFERGGDYIMGFGTPPNDASLRFQIETGVASAQGAVVNVLTLHGQVTTLLNNSFPGFDFSGFKGSRPFAGRPVMGPGGTGRPGLGSGTIEIVLTAPTTTSTSIGKVLSGAKGSTVTGTATFTQTVGTAPTPVAPGEETPAPAPGEDPPPRSNPPR